MQFGVVELHPQRAAVRQSHRLIEAPIADSQVIEQAQQIAKDRKLKLDGAGARERTTVYTEPGRGAIYLLNVFIIPEALRPYYFHHQYLMQLAGQKPLPPANLRPLMGEGPEVGAPKREEDYEAEDALGGVPVTA